MVSSIARAMGIIALLAALANAGDELDGTRPGNPVILYPGNGSTVPAERPVEVTWEMPSVFALPAGYEVEIQKSAGGKWTRRAHGRTSGRAQGTAGFRLEPGTYLVFLTAENPGGRAQARTHIFRVMPQVQIDAAISQVSTRTETNPDGTPKAPTGPGSATGAGGGAFRGGAGLAGGIGGLVDGPGVASKSKDGAPSPAAKNEGGSASTSSSSSKPEKPEKPAAPKEDRPENASAPRPEPRPSAPDPEVEDTGAAVVGGAEGAVKPTGHGSGAGVAPAPEPEAEERRSVRGRLVVLQREGKLDFARTIARVDAAIERLKADDTRAEAGEEETTAERVGGDLEVWVVEIPKPPKKKGAAMQPVRRYRVTTFEDASELSRLRDKNGHKIAIEGLFTYSEAAPATGEAGDMKLAKIVFMAPAR